MSVANCETFKIGDLAKIALGCEELTNDRLHVLQYLFLALLRKLNCHNETVKITGMAAKCLQRLLNDCLNSCQCNFQFENIHNFQNKYQLLEQLERKTQEIDIKLKRHFQQIRNRNRSTIFAANHWRVYASPTEDLGGVSLKQNRKFWFLLESTVFNVEIRRGVVPQLTDKLKEFENKIETMEKQLQEIIQLADQTTEKMHHVGHIIKDIECLRSGVNLEEKVFRDAIAEVDEMLSCKLHRVTVPALKKYLETRFDEANRHLRVLKAQANKCLPTKPVLIDDKKTCLSCCHHRDFTLFKKFKKLKSIDDHVKCSCCNLLKDPSIKDKMERMLYSDVTGKYLAV